MKCEKTQELFSSYLENAIEPPVRVVLEQHFAECAECKAQFEQFRAAAMLLDELPEVAPPAGFHAAVMARVEQARRATPHAVRWWTIDWHGIFNARVPVRAVAMAAAVLLLIAIVVSLSPAGAIIAGLLGGKDAKCPAVGDPSETPPGPIPWRADSTPQIQYLREDAGLSIGVEIDDKSKEQIVYTLRFATRSGETLPLEAYLLSKDTPSSRLVNGSISEDAESTVPVVVSRTASPVVVQVKWEYDGKGMSEYVFLPATYSSSEADRNASLSVPAGTLRESLGAVSSAYGIIVMTSGDIGTKSSAVNVEYGSPDSALFQAIRSTGLRARALSSSVYAIEPAE